tara:strand:+ start:537 stop:647 length:111 start_codon:yes stop_codon:yes gene_type:complete
VVVVVRVVKAVEWARAREKGKVVEMVAVRDRAVVRE